MNIFDMLDDLIHDMKARKEVWVKDHPDDPNMPSTLFGYREDDLVGQAFCMPDRDKMLNLVNYLSYGWACDVVTLGYETYHTSLEKNPITDLEWGPGEMQELAEQYDGIKKGWVTDSLTLSGYDRDLNCFLAALHFRTDGENVEWLGEPIIFRSDSNDGDKFDGLVHDAMCTIMKNKTINDSLLELLGEEKYREAVESLSPVAAKVHQDLAAVKFVLSQDMALGASLTAAEGSERQAYIRKNVAESEEDGVAVVTLEH